MTAGLGLRPDAIMIGIAPMGGRLPEQWRGWLKDALEAGCDIWSGLHTFIQDDPMLGALATRLGRTIMDVRKPPADLPVSSG